MNSKDQMLKKLYQDTHNWTNCKLAGTRNNFVFGEGYPSAYIMFIGEGPGREEDLKARPFVGKAGMLLTDIIEKGMLLKRKDVYIANIVKCRPTVDLLGSRDRAPDRGEVEACSWILLKQIEIIQPKVIITLGNPATQFLLKVDTGITRMRGRFSNYNSIPVMPTYHPSYILRNNQNNHILKKEVWHDIKEVLKYLGYNR